MSFNKSSDFRFGIHSLQLGSLGSVGGQGQPAPMGFDHLQRVRELAEQGFNPIELNTDVPLLLPDTFSPDALEQLLALKSEFGVGYTVHLPILSVDPSTPLRPVRLGAVQATVDIIRATLPLDPEVYVYHATGALAADVNYKDMPEWTRMLLWRVCQQYARESLSAILAETGLSRHKLAVETIEFPFDLTLELADDLDVCMCLDTAHVLVGYSGPVDLFDALEQALPRLAEVHLNDGPWQGPEHVIRRGKDHLPIGSGDLDVLCLLDRLEGAQFRGPLVFELTLDESLRSLQVIESVSALRKAA